MRIERVHKGARAVPMGGTLSDEARAYLERSLYVVVSEWQDSPPPRPSEGATSILVRRTEDQEVFVVTGVLPFPIDGLILLVCVEGSDLRVGDHLEVVASRGGTA